MIFTKLHNFVDRGRRVSSRTRKGAEQIGPRDSPENRFDVSSEAEFTGWARTETQIETGTSVAGGQLFPTLEFEQQETATQSHQNQDKGQDGSIQNFTSHDIDLL